MSPYKKIWRSVSGKHVSAVSQLHYIWTNKTRVWFYHRKPHLIGDLELFVYYWSTLWEREENNLCKFSKAFQGSNPKGIHLCVCFPISRWRRNAYSQSHIGLETGRRCWLSTVTSLEDFFFFQIFLMSFWGIGGTGGNLISYFYINGVKGCVYSFKFLG